VGDEKLKYLADPLEVVLMHKVLPVCKKLSIEENSESFLKAIKQDMFTKLSYHFKIGDPVANPKDSMCYQRIDNAFKTIQKNAA